MERIEKSKQMTLLLDLFERKKRYLEKFAVHRQNFHLYDDAQISLCAQEINEMFEVYNSGEMSKYVMSFFKRVIKDTDPKKIIALYDRLPLKQAEFFRPLRLALDVLIEIGDCRKFPKEERLLMEFIGNCRALAREDEINRRVVSLILLKTVIEPR